MKTKAPWWKKLTGVWLSLCAALGELVIITAYVFWAPMLLLAWVSSLGKAKRIGLGPVPPGEAGLRRASAIMGRISTRWDEGKLPFETAVARLARLERWSRKREFVVQSPVLTQLIRELMWAGLLVECDRRGVQRPRLGTRYIEL